MACRDFRNWVRKKLDEGWEIHSCYEAGATGYWLPENWSSWGSKTWWVVPKAMGRYLRGQDKVLSAVTVPTEEQEEKRALIRYHRQIMADRGCCEARGKGLLCAQGMWRQRRRAAFLSNPKSSIRRPALPRAILRNWQRIYR